MLESGSLLASRGVDHRSRVERGASHIHRRCGCERGCGVCESWLSNLMRTVRTIEIQGIEYLRWVRDRGGEVKTVTEKRTRWGHTAGIALTDATSVKYAIPSVKSICHSPPRPPGTINLKPLMVMTRMIKSKPIATSD